MKVFTFGIARIPVLRSLAALISPPTSRSVPGLVHAECLAAMRLGSPIFSNGRLQLRNLTMFAAWDSDQAIDDFLDSSTLGNCFAKGWHLRMSFLRRWGSVREFAELPEDTGEGDPLAPVAAFTLARLKIPEVTRFIKFGKPVEELIRDHPESTFALAAFRFPRSFATFSLWTSQQAMTEMVQGRGEVSRSDRHALAMQERDRRDFHREFTTLRFKPLSQHGNRDWYT